jgi:enoyl-[acyl-carrier-protein] reductase (NADH)
MKPEANLRGCGNTARVADPVMVSAYSLKSLIQLALLTVTITVQSSVDNSTPTVLTVPSHSFWGVELQAMQCLDTTTQMTVDCGTPTVKAPAISSGPFRLMASDGVNCYCQPYMNPNMTFPKTAAQAWCSCP